MTSYTKPLTPEQIISITTVSVPEEGEKTHYLPKDAEMLDSHKRLKRLVNNRMEIDLFGHAYMPVPVDADNAPIRLGDYLRVDGGYGVYIVIDMTYCPDGWVIGTNRGLIRRPEENAHHLDTESILREFALARKSAGNSDSEVARLAREYAKRLRPKEEDD